MKQLVNSEIVVVCTKTQAQVTRIPSLEVLDRMAADGVRCACGRGISEERVEEAISITDLGRSLLDKSRWLTVLLMDELQKAGVSLDRMLIEQQVGGDELDCLADIGGELAMFELKDKDFSLGDAYSFGAKIGIIRPKYPVIFSTQKVGTDAREHFDKSRGSRRAPAWASENEPGPIRYIEGMSNLRNGIEDLGSEIYGTRASSVLVRVMPFAALSASALMSAFADRDKHQLFTQVAHSSMARNDSPVSVSDPNATATAAKPRAKSGRKRPVDLHEIERDGSEVASPVRSAQ